MTAEIKQLNNYIELWKYKEDNFYTDNEFISFVYNFDINKHPQKINIKFYFIVCQCLNIYLKNEFNIFVNDMINFINDNDKLLFIPTMEDIKRDALTHIQEEYKRLIDEHILFKKIKEVQLKYNCKPQEQIHIFKSDEPLIPWYVR